MKSVQSPTAAPAVWRAPVALALTLLACLGAPAFAANSTGFRPPSVPLVACDPYFSIWSPANSPADADTVHWTGRPHRLTSLVRIDGKAYRLMGKQPADLAPLNQTGVQVLPTRTIYTFETGGVRLKLTFTTPALPEDLMIYSRPVTYVEWAAESLDGASHTVEAYLDAGPEICVNTPDQTVQWSDASRSGVTALRVGSVEQPVLQKRGDDLRIDWGYFYLAGQKSQVRSAALAAGSVARSEFVAKGSVSPAKGQVPAMKASDSAAPVLAMTVSLGKVARKPVSRWLLLAYDDEFSIQYFKKNLRPYWRRNGDDAAALLKKSVSEYEALARRCARFDDQLMADLARAGGEQYARICALAYRQCVAANKLVADENGQPLLFPKENFSNGCIGTVDLLYPMGPQFLLLSPTLTKAMLVPLMDYSASPRWRWPFAPHDMGTYPHANGQVYGGGERTEENQMPVEETGNMLILLAALADVEGNANFCTPWWPVLEKWAEYLKAKGFDPENQLCTDDFAGHMAHNVNLSAKAICGLGAYARLCEMRGLGGPAAEHKKIARELAARWVSEADDGDHFRLAFDKTGTWSQKYNLVWDRILGLNLFPAEVARKEMAFYRAHQNKYGLPLDSRKDYTKLDWILWTATLTQNRADFDALVGPVHQFLNETPNRVPMTDWYDTKTGRHVGFQARPVVGGVFLQMLYDKFAWKAWAGRDTTKPGKWAPMPTPPKIVTVVPTSESAPTTWRYTTESPGDDWMKPGFADGNWKEAPGGFGTAGTPSAVVRTEWNGARIWLRRAFSLPEGDHSGLQLRIHHDEDADVYIDGVLAASLPGYSTDYDLVPIKAAALARLKPGQHILAIHCKQTGGGQYIDAGLARVESKK